MLSAPAMNEVAVAGGHHVTHNATAGGDRPSLKLFDLGIKSRSVFKITNCDLEAGSRHTQAPPEVAG